MVARLPVNLRSGRLWFAALVALGLTACREAAPGPGAEGLVVRVESNLMAPPDSWLVAIKRESSNLVLAEWGRSGETVVIDQLDPGSYKVALAGFVDSLVEQFGLREGVEVVAGRTTEARISPASFLPQLSAVDEVPGSPQDRRVEWLPVPFATGYIVEWDQDSLFPDPDSTSVPGSQLFMVLRFPEGGRFAVRVRAFHEEFVSPAEGITSDTVLFSVARPVLAFAGQPSDALIDSLLLPPVLVEVRDTAGSLVSDAAVTVTVGLTGGTAGAVLGGTVSVTAARGVAVFDDLTVDRPGTFSLVATADSIAGDTSTTFTISSPVPPQPEVLSFTVQPSNVPVDSAITPAVTVELRDSTGALVTGSVPVTLALGNNPGGATLSGTTTVNTTAGSATFDDLSLDAVASGYTLVATAPGAIPDTSAAFEAFLPQLRFLVQPSSITVFDTVTPPVQVSFVDPSGGTLPLMNGPVTLSLASATNVGTLSGSLTVTAVAGIAAFNDLSLNEPGDYTIQASSTAAGSVISQTLTVMRR